MWFRKNRDFGASVQKVKFYILTIDGSRKTRINVATMYAHYILIVNILVTNKIKIHYCKGVRI